MPMVQKHLTLSIFLTFLQFRALSFNIAHWELLFLTFLQFRAFFLFKICSKLLTCKKVIFSVLRVRFRAFFVHFSKKVLETAEMLEMRIKVCLCKKVLETAEMCQNLKMLNVFQTIGVLKGQWFRKHLTFSTCLQFRALF